jgi:cell division protein FtsQ
LVNKTTELKKISYKKILVAVLWIIAIAGLASSLRFVSKSERNIIAGSLNISIFNNEENLFLDEEDVKRFLSERNDSVLSVPYARLDIPGLEKVLNSHPAIENAEVSADMSGEVKIDIRQRTPVLRIINKDGESYYIDSQAKLMPLNENYSARVIVASGEIYEPYARRYQFSVDQIRKSDVFSEVSLLDDLLDVTQHIRKDSCLTNLIHQVYVNADKDIELFPAIGNHKIIFGDAKNIAEKFNKLKLFYTQGLNKSDGWTKYSAINLKYKNLVVCTKK